ncbi:type II toxin-antitoxin system VapC family toxin [Castellaniella hirudinis]|uniref:type II toxin-antitoxin system VapC family toxin n=1 Tax=Castellaniella hirudinis TaxID=1144617 RepID=UPI0039C431B7
MILLDTNVISEQFRAVPDETVIDWLNRQPLETLYLASMTVAELRAGVALMPAGKRRTVLSDSIEHQVLPLFVGRVLSFDMACTRAYADVLAAARKIGSGIEAADAVIAAIALDNGFSVATRDVSPFLAAGVKVINPWENQE